MTPTEYIEAAIRTGGYQSKFYGELVPLRIYNGAMNNAVIIANHLDKMKKSLFYGRENAFAWLTGGEQSLEGLGQKTIDTLLGIVGIFTEAGELIEALKKPSIDKVNIKEELGDVLWYVAVLCKTHDFSFEDIMETNIAKMKARFPEKFNEHDANNRDLDNERKVLEGNG